MFGGKNRIRQYKFRDDSYGVADMKQRPPLPVFLVSEGLFPESEQQLAANGLCVAVDGTCLRGLPLQPQSSAGRSASRARVADLGPVA